VARIKVVAARGKITSKKNSRKEQQRGAKGNYGEAFSQLKSRASWEEGKVYDFDLKPPSTQGVTGSDLRTETLDRLESNEGRNIPDKTR